MTLDSAPDVAENIIRFEGTPGRAAILNYSVPLPGRLVGRRAVLLDLGLSASDWTALAHSVGTAIAASIKLQQSAAGYYTFDPGTALELWIEHAVTSGVPGDQIDLVREYRGTLATEYASFAPGAKSVTPRAVSKTARKRAARKSTGVTGIERTPEETVGSKPYPPEPEGLPPELKPVIDYLNGLTMGRLLLPKGKIGGGVGTVAVPTQPSAPATPPAALSNPQLMLIEIYCVSSFLGDYGLGRTVKTFTLLPGETTNISLKTWRSSEKKQTDAASIIDSFSQSAASKFRGAVQFETSNRTVTETTTAGGPGAPSPTSPPFSLDSIGIDLFGYFKVNASGQYGTETHTSRDDFTKTVMDCVHEHANEASSKRENTVTSSSEWSEKTGEETVTERTIKNVNLRRVLNFVFRELNQEYLTKVHLREVRLAFTNGKSLSYREVPLSGLRRLLQDVLVPAQVDPVAQKVLKQCSVVFDVDDDAVPVLEKVTMSADGQSWTPAAATMVNNNFPPPTDSMFYRFRRGALGQDADTPNPVEGVVLEEDRVTLRTDSVVVEALLGQADALDEYAMEMQRAEAEQRTLANDREKAAQEALADITGGDARTAAYAAMFKPVNPALRVEVIHGGET